MNCYFRTLFISLVQQVELKDSLEKEKEYRKAAGLKMRQQKASPIRMG
jgi:hypothetical protein